MIDNNQREVANASATQQIFEAQVEKWLNHNRRRTLVIKARGVEPDIQKIWEIKVPKSFVSFSCDKRNRTASQSYKSTKLNCKRDKKNKHHQTSIKGNLLK